MKKVCQAVKCVLIATNDLIVITNLIMCHVKADVYELLLDMSVIIRNICFGNVKNRLSGV